MSVKPVSLRLDKEKLERLDHLAEAMGRSRNWALNQAIDNYLDYEEWFVQEVKMGIKEAGNPDSLVGNDAVKQQLEKRLADRLDKNLG